MRRIAVPIAIVMALLSLVGLNATTAYAAPAAPVSSNPNPGVGEKVTLTGDIGTPTKRSVELQKYSSGKWKKYASGTTTSAGLYSFTASTTAPSRAFRVYAKSASGLGSLTSAQVVLTTTPDDGEGPGTPPASGSLPAPVSSNPLPFAGQQVTLSGDTATSVARPIELQKYSSGKWSKYASGTTTPAGLYSFEASTTASSRAFRVYAKSANGLGSLTSGQILLTTQTDSVTLSIARVGNSVQASGIATPAIQGRLFALQYKSGSSYKAIGSKTAAAVDGTITFAPTPVDGTRSYRLVGDGVDGGPPVTSATVNFSPGPSKLGTNVIYVSTDNGKDPQIKGVGYTGAATIVAGTDVSAAIDVDTFAVRGNSTANKAKKPYKLKFTEKQKPFGMKADKTWVLLANYGDHTLIRSRIAFELGRKQDGLKWTPDERFTELFVNGKYAGSYQILQSIKIDKDRVNVNKTNGQVIEFDPHWKADGVPGFVGLSGQNFSWKDPDEFKNFDDGFQDPNGLTNAKIAAMKTKITNFEKVLYGSDKKKDWSKVNTATLDSEDDWTTYLDLSSAVDYYLVKEFTKDNDADFYRSNYFYTNNVDPAASDKLFMGPIWDFDRSAGAPPAGGTNIASPQGWWVRGQGSVNHDTNKIHWFTRISKDPRFLDALEARWSAKRGDYRYVATSGVSAAVSSLSTAAAENDRNLWGKSGGRYHSKTSSYSGEINWVRNWYKDRYNWVDKELSPSGSRNPIS